MYLGKPISNRLRQLFQSIIYLKDEDFINEKKNMINILTLEFEKSGYCSNNKLLLPLLISYEPFLSPNYYDSFINEDINRINYRTINRLNEIFTTFDEVNYLIIIRKYKDILKSYFSEISNKYNAHFSDKNFFLNLQKKSQRNINILNNFFYSEKIRIFDELALNYKIMLYEDFNHYKSRFYRELSLFLRLKDPIDVDNIPLEIVNPSDINTKFFGFFNFILAVKKFVKNNQHKINENIFNIYAYYKFLKKIVRLFIRNINFTKIKIPDLENNKELIIKFYQKDFDNLPEELKKKCIFHDYLK